MHLWWYVNAFLSNRTSHQNFLLHKKKPCKLFISTVYKALSTYQQMDFPGNGSFLPKSSRPAESMILFSHVLFIELLKYICCKTDGFQTAYIVFLIDLYQL